MTALSAELLLRIERADAALALEHGTAAQSPELHVRDFGGPVAFVTLDRRNTLFNRCVGLGPDDGEHVAEIAGFFRELGVPPRIDVCPSLRSEELARALREQGLEPGGFPFFSKRVLVGPTRTGLGAVPGVAIEKMELPALEEFVAIQQSAWPVDEATLRRIEQETRATHALPGRYRYFARIADMRVAVAAMELRGEVAYFNLATTLEAHRRRGCQTALLGRRLQDASRAGARVAFSLVSPDSASERNIVRAGLDAAYDRELWLPPDWTAHPFYRDAG
jgi:hypothetical protein